MYPPLAGGRARLPAGSRTRSDRRDVRHVRPSPRSSSSDIPRRRQTEELVAPGPRMSTSPSFWCTPFAGRRRENAGNAPPPTVATAFVPPSSAPPSRTESATERRTGRPPPYSKTPRYSNLAAAASQVFVLGARALSQLLRLRAELVIRQSALHRRHGVDRGECLVPRRVRPAAGSPYAPFPFRLLIFSRNASRSAEPRDPWDGAERVSCVVSSPARRARRGARRGQRPVREARAHRGGGEAVRGVRWEVAGTRVAPRGRARVPVSPTRREGCRKVGGGAFGGLDLESSERDADGAPDASVVVGARRWAAVVPRTLRAERATARGKSLRFGLLASSVFFMTGRLWYLPLLQML